MGLGHQELAGSAHAQRVERGPERARVAAVRVGVDAARHAEEQALRLVGVGAQDLAGQTEGDARHLRCREM